MNIIEDVRIRPEAPRGIDKLQPGLEIVERFRIEGGVLRGLQVPAAALEPTAHRDIAHQFVGKMPVHRGAPRQFAEGVAVAQRLLRQQR